ncbi:pentapeptide repeat-containing protein [Nonomuraea sp. NPDC050547]|uniref:pentapeptide repeat-containing protein n=1 Tax=unclassified Nonomuraea TaxID=2593643 RepID=UPI00379ED83C
MAERKHGAPAPPTESAIRSGEWDGRDLDHETFRRVLFVDVDMTEMINRGSAFEECTFSQVRFNVSEHDDSSFVNCTFRRCSFFDATFRACKFTGSMFDGCSYGLLKVEGGDWSFVGLPGADLRGSAFHGVRLREADLTGARLEKAEILRSDLSGAWLHSADLTACDLRGSDLAALDPQVTTVKKAIIDSFQATVVAAALGFDVR